MAINRNSYTSLIESVNEAVSATPSSERGIAPPVPHGRPYPRKPARVPNSPRPVAQTARSQVPMNSTASSMYEDWDLIDEILAEGLELYGEDGLAEILADYAETGEISEELALLLSDE